MAVAFLFGTWLALREARRLHLDEDKVVSVILVALVCGVLGARMLYVLEHVSEFRREWGSVLALWQGGLTLYGGMVAGVFGGLLMARRLQLPIWVTADALAPSLTIGGAIGRVGCFLNGCCYGRPTRLPWGVTFPSDSFAGLDFGNAKIHPSQLYFSLAGVVLFGIVWALRKRMAPAGTLFWFSLLLYGLVRIPLDFTRAYEPETAFLTVFGLEIVESQLSSLAIALFSLLMILRLRRESLAPSASAVA
jgi:phosphatidylglycerol---prolipoprotein diacylglyceryl transferase